MQKENCQKTEVTVIIPTTAEEKRFKSLKNAVSSIREASSKPIGITVVVNGQRFSSIVVEWIKSQSDINYIYSEKGSAPHAQLIGRQSVQTDFFCFLDDDDEFLPYAIDTRLEKIKENPGTGVVVTNGYTLKSGTKKIQYQNLEQLVNSGIDGLLVSNWLGSCNHLMRTSIVSSSFFDDYHPYYEWTWLAFKLCDKKITLAAIDTTTFIYNDTEGSASKSLDYRISYEKLALKMLKKVKERRHKSLIKIKLSNHYHRMAEYELKKENFSSAVKFHVKSLASNGLIKYIMFTRHIIISYIKIMLKNKRKQ
ncbi:glycosyltransferase [Alkalimonas sp.]|uniref:glycosyltransferase n=1 Tax=Alkalimonas sp. TaxID=1872453 RepID=UPI00263A7F26|nr:glycosyltransferase [Alkalimonas sp.]MCC5827188.1 glycosyltransferase [Alkalimonas sp.]